MHLAPRIIKAYNVYCSVDTPANSIIAGCVQSNIFAKIFLYPIIKRTLEGNPRQTITTIPTYRLVSDSFINWRGMNESGGRRIKRSILIKVSSIKFLEDNKLSELKKIERISDYIIDRKNEIEEENKTNRTVPRHGISNNSIGARNADAPSTKNNKGI